jgi:hypothetical protein
LQEVEEAVPVGTVAPYDPYRQQSWTVLDHHTPFDVYCVYHRHTRLRSESATCVYHLPDETVRPSRTVSCHSDLSHRGISRRDGENATRTVYCRRSSLVDGARRRRIRLYSNLCRPSHGDGHDLFYDGRKNDVSTLRTGLGTDGVTSRMMLLYSN